MDFVHWKPDWLIRSQHSCPPPGSHFCPETFFPDFSTIFQISLTFPENSQKCPFPLIFLWLEKVFSFFQVFQTRWEPCLPGKRSSFHIYLRVRKRVTAPWIRKWVTAIPQGKSSADLDSVIQTNPSKSPNNCQVLPQIWLFVWNILGHRSEIAATCQLTGKLDFEWPFGF